MLNCVNATKNYAAFCNTETARLALEKRSASVLCNKVIENRLKALLKIFHREIFFVIQLVVWNTIAATKIDELQILKLKGNSQNVCNSIKIRLWIHKKRTDVLVDSDNCKIVLSGNFKNLRNKFFGNSKLSFLTAGNNFFVMAGTYTRIDADCNLTALVE